jgi:hypothetical protein
MPSISRENIHMTPSASLTGSHLRTYNTIFQHPVSHNLEWRAVRALMGRLCDVTEELNGNLKVVRNGKTLIIHQHRTKDVAEVEELMVLRHFIEESEGAQAGTPTAEAQWLLVIDHHEARIFRSEMKDAVPERVAPHEPEAFFRHAHNAKDFTRGREKPDPNSYFEPVARALSVGGRILIFGTGTGTASEMEQFVAWLGRHHPDIAKRVIGSQVVDENHMSDGQLLAKAREFHAAAPAA